MYIPGGVCSYERKNIMIRFILINLLFAALYLWAVENNRYICLVMWFVVPFVDIFLYWLLIERKEIKNVK